MAANFDSIYATMPDWCARSGMRPSRTYDELSRGNLRAKKIGKRLLIDGKRCSAVVLLFARWICWMTPNRGASSYHYGRS